MRLNSNLIIALLYFFFSACGLFCPFSTKAKLKSDMVQVREHTQIADIGMKQNREFIVRNKIDLKGRQVNVPEGVTITFKKGGALVNGTLNGDSTKLNSKTENVLGVKLKGTWLVDKVSDLLFSTEFLSDTEIINNLNAIQSDAMTNVVTIHRDYQISISKSGGAGLTPSSHSIIQLMGTLSLESNNYASYQIIYIKNKQMLLLRVEE